LVGLGRRLCCAGLAEPDPVQIVMLVDRRAVDHLDTVPGLFNALN
jgi:hypothetical protein